MRKVFTGAVPAVTLKVMPLPTVNYLVFGASTAPTPPSFRRPHPPSGADDLRDAFLGFAVAPAGREAACQWLAAVPQQRWVFIFASSQQEAQWLAGHTRARVMYADSMQAAIASGGMRDTPHGPMVAPSELEQAFQRAAGEFESVASAMAEQRADFEHLAENGNART